MELRLRGYAPGDFRELTRIDQVCFPEDIAFRRAELRSHATHPTAITLIADVDARIAGFLIAHVQGHRAAHLITLDVVPQMRRRGVATRLLGRLHALLERRGILWSILEVDAGNSAAVRLYERLGYQAVETIPGYYNGTRDALRMIRVAPTADPTASRGDAS